jgi:uncharacterized BrkB/YihY/UPF0761 family membrane protein
MWLTVISVIVIIGAILSAFDDSLPNGRFWTIAKKALLFIPYLIIGVILHVIGDFKNHRVGYIFIFIIISFVCWGMYMGYKVGPNTPPTWDN